MTGIKVAIFAAGCMAIMMLLTPPAKLSGPDVIVLAGPDEVVRWLEAEDWWGEESHASQLDVPNVLITGHHAFLTEEALTNIADTSIYNLDCWSAGQETEHELTRLAEVI